MDFESEPSFGDDLKNFLRRGKHREEKLVIGLDLGTNYSSVAYGFTTEPEHIYVITTWPGAHGRNRGLLPPSKPYIQGIGSIFDPELDLLPIDAKAELGKLGKSAHEVVTDYIGAIYRYTTQYIGSEYPKSHLDLLKKQHVLSVPAVYSDRAKSEFLRAARDAGIFPSKLITVPEATALLALHDIGGKGFEIGDNLVICNAGEAEFDVASFEIVNLERLEFRESTFSAGSLKLNQRFEEWVKDIVGEQPFVELRKKDGYRQAMRQFEDFIKPGFQSRHDDIVTQELGSNRQARARDVALEDLVPRSQGHEGQMALMAPEAQG